MINIIAMVIGYIVMVVCFITIALNLFWELSDWFFEKYGSFKFSAQWYLYKDEFEQWLKDNGKDEL